MPIATTTKALTTRVPNCAVAVLYCIEHPPLANVIGYHRARPMADNALLRRSRASRFEDLFSLWPGESQAGAQREGVHL